jgi:aminopeptidase N
VNARRAAAAGVLVLATLAGCSPTTPVISSVGHASPSVTPTPGSLGPPGAGSDGIGDPLVPASGNGGYDVSNYDLDVRYDPASGELTGTAKITARASMALNRFNLDLRPFTIDEVTVDGEKATSSAAKDELTVTPPAPINQNASFVTTVRYRGKPVPYDDPILGAGGFLATRDGAVAIGEPQVAASWYPVNDHPRDKATYTIKITAPDGLTAMSNGVLAGKQSNAGWTTWTWAEGKPMASYLATAVIGNFRVTQSSHNGKPVFLAVAQSLDAETESELAQTPQIVDWLETKFGPYPFDAIGGIIIDDSRIRYALENQTRPIYGAVFFKPNRVDTTVMAHELAHQWYGDSVSVDTWSDIWLNEGFATYAEWMWEDEKLHGKTLQQQFDGNYTSLPANFWTTPIGKPPLTELFGDAVYTRGGMTLLALRKTIGDDVFTKLLRDWAAKKADGNARTDEFIALAEQESGKQLDKFFDDWLYQPKRPSRP